MSEASVVIELDIENEQQRYAATCWASCVSQSVRFLSGRRIDEQRLCDLVGIGPDEGASERTIVGLLDQLGGIDCNPITTPSPHGIASVLARQQPIIVSLQTGPDRIGHAVLLRGAIQARDHWRVVINDPTLASGFSLYVPFPKLLAAWRSGIVLSATR